MYFPHAILIRQLGRTALHLVVENYSINVTTKLALAGANCEIKSNVSLQAFL